jgi:hypothetical protein
MVRLFGSAETRTNALQFLPGHLPVPPRSVGRLFRGGPVRQSGAGDLAGAGLAGVLFRQQLAVRGAAAGVDRVQLPHRIATDLRAAALHTAICGPDGRRGRRSRGARLLQICRLPRRQSKRDLFDRPHAQRPAAGGHLILHLHPDCVPGRRLQGKCRAAMRCRITRCSSPISRI